MNDAEKDNLRQPYIGWPLTTSPVVMVENTEVINKYVGGRAQDRIVVIFSHVVFKNCHFHDETRDVPAYLFRHCKFIDCTFSRDILGVVAFHLCTGVIFRGVQDGYTVLATAQSKGGYIIHAGCRKFRRAQALKHWYKGKRGRVNIRRVVLDIVAEAAWRAKSQPELWSAK